MKIDTKPLGISKNSVEAVGSWGEQDQADELMITLYSIDAAGDDMVKSLKAERETIKQAMTFFTNVLHLSKDQAKRVFDNVPGETMNLYISYVCGLIKGAPYQSFEKFKASLKGANETDPKDEPEKADE